MPVQVCKYTWKQVVVHADPNEGFSPPLLFGHLACSQAGRNSLFGRQLLQGFLHHVLDVCVERTPRSVSDGNGYLIVFFIITIFFVHGGWGLVVGPQSTGR